MGNGSRGEEATSLLSSLMPTSGQNMSVRPLPPQGVVMASTISAAGLLEGTHLLKQDSKQSPAAEDGFNFCS